MQNTTPAALGIANSGIASQEVSTERGLAPPILLQYWQVVLRWKWLILGITAAALTLGLVSTLLTTPQYTAKQVMAMGMVMAPTNAQKGDMGSVFNPIRLSLQAK